ncbi:hypothetical protein ACFPA8_06020 [Streptomyces ovatisporus]|uniref:GNAT family N-acetyltransferase n=1 Tax=Streptomyces ovatisporus TaxID=1128682 RepID=A0ABV9A7Z1_9ACTN
MPKQGRGTSAGADLDHGGRPPLPDLTGVDLRLLRVTDDPAVHAAVDDVLRGPERFTGKWWGTDTGNGG